MNGHGNLAISSTEWHRIATVYRLCLISNKCFSDGPEPAVLYVLHVCGGSDQPTRGRVLNCPGTHLSHFQRWLVHAFSNYELFASDIRISKTVLLYKKYYNHFS